MKNKRLFSLFVCLLFTIFCHAVIADGMFRGFEAVDVDSSPVDWTVLDMDPADPPADFNVMVVGGSRRLACINRESSLVDICYFNGTSDEGVHSSTWKDYSVSTVIRCGAWRDHWNLFTGIAARVQTAAGPNQGNAIYARLVGKSDADDNYLEIGFIRNNGTSILSRKTIAASPADDSFDSYEDWVLTLSVFDNPEAEMVEIKAFLYPVDVADGESQYLATAWALDYATLVDNGLDQPGPPAVIALKGGLDSASNIMACWDNVEVTFEKNDVPMFLAHYYYENDPYTDADKFGDAYWQADDHDSLYSFFLRITEDTKGNVSFEPNGKYDGAMSVDTGYASYRASTIDVFHPYDVARTMEFWWKPNFTKPATTTSFPVFTWPDSSQQYSLKYHYNSSTGQDYLAFYYDDGVNAVQTVPLTNAVDFNGYNYIAFGYYSNLQSSTDDKVFVKLNSAPSAKMNLGSAGLATVWNTYFELYNGIFDEVMVTGAWKTDAELEASRTLGKEFEPDRLPDTCQEAYLYYGTSIFPEDINGDCEVNFADFAEMASGWLDCIIPGDPTCSQPWD